MTLTRRGAFGLISLAVATLATVTFVSPAFAKSTKPAPPPKTPPPKPPPPEPKPKDILDTLAASSDPSFTTLLDAVKAADLTSTLKGKGPFTLFAPTDGAFKKLDTEKLAELMKPANKAHLKAVLNYHLAAQKLMSADIAKLTTIKTANGASLTVKPSEDKSTWSVDEVTPSKTDVVAANGVIHFVPAVLMPKEQAGGAAPSDPKPPK